MAAKVRCPACKQVLTVPDGFAAETAKCPKCGQLLRLKPPAPQAEPSAAASPPPPPVATPPPPPPTSRPARPSRPAAHRRPAPRPKRRSPWPWLAGIGAIAALVALALVAGVVPTSILTGRAWQTDVDIFLEQLGRTLPEFGPMPNAKAVVDKYEKQGIRWTLTLNRIEEIEGGKYHLDFDLESHGLYKKVFSSKWPVILGFDPDPASLADWRKVKQGTAVEFEGVVSTIAFGQAGDSGRALVFAIVTGCRVKR